MLKTFASGLKVKRGSTPSLLVHPNPLEVSNQLQNELLERIGEGQEAVDDISNHRTKLANNVINDLRVALFQTLENGDEKVGSAQHGMNTLALRRQFPKDHLTHAEHLFSFRQCQPLFAR